METESNNLIIDFFVNLYIQTLFLFHYWIRVLTRRFIPDGSANRNQRRTIMDSLISNFASEEISLINPNESVEETFARKIEEKDYESAMKLAKKFDFDMDPIYCHMWEMNRIDIKLIDECLTKVSDTIWVLNECVECVPQDLDSLKYLLQFGIDLSSRDILFQSYLVNPTIKELVEDNLTLDGKKFVQYRLNLLKYLERLILYEEILKCKYNEDDNNLVKHFNSSFYHQIRNKSSFELAIYYANNSDYESLAVMLKKEANLSKHFLVLLSNLSETISPLKYENVLKHLFTKLNLEPEDEFEDLDWSYNLLGSKHEISEFEARFYEKNPQYKNFVINFRLNHELLIQWLRTRSLEILENTALVEHSLQLLDCGIQIGKLEELENLYTQLDLFSLLLYETEFDSTSISFNDFEKRTLIDKMNLILGRHEAINIIENLFDGFIQKLTKYQKVNQSQLDIKSLLKEFMVNLSKSGQFDKCLKIFQNCSMVDKTLEQIQSFKMINDACEFIELALECIRSYQDPDCLDMAFQVMECLPERSQGSLLMGNDPSRIRHFNRINDEADQIEYYLSMIEVFRDYNTRLTIQDIISIVENKKSSIDVEQFFNKLITNFCANKFNPSINIELEWKNFFWNLQDFRKSSFDQSIQFETLVELAVNNLLFSADTKLIRLAFNHISLNPNKKVSSNSWKKVPYAKGKEMLKKAASDYIKYAHPIQDQNIELARTCLEQYQDDIDDDEIQTELDLIQALKLIYTDFNYEILPIKVKQFAQPRLNLIESLVQCTPKISYAKTMKILEISKLLRVYNDQSDDFRDGIVLSLIGKKAIENNDLELAHNACRIILDRNLVHGWELCYLFGKMTSSTNSIDNDLLVNNIDTNYKEQLTLLSFALACCPESDIEAHFNILNEIKSLKSNNAMFSKTLIQFKMDKSLLTVH